MVFALAQLASNRDTMKNAIDDVVRTINGIQFLLINQRLENLSHSHSMVAGGLPDTSYTTRLMPRTSLMMRLLTLPNSS